MGFDWLCPICEEEHWYGGKATTKATARCGTTNLKIWQYKIIPPLPPPKPPQATTKKLPDIRLNGSLASLIVMCNYAINTIKNKEEVIAKKEDSTWYAHYKSWTSIREYFQRLEDEKG